MPTASPQPATLAPDAGPARQRPEERRQQLLRFGRAYFAQHPYDGASMAQIARAAGVSKGLLYHYFGGRRGFYIATIDQVVSEVLDATDPPEGVAFDAALRAMLVRFVTYARDNGPIYLALVRGGLGADPEVVELLEKIRRVSMERIMERGELGAPSSLARVVLWGWMSFVETATAAWLDTPEVSMDALVDVLTAAFTPMLAALSAGDFATAATPSREEAP